MIFILSLIDLLKENPLKILTEAKFCYNGNAPWVSQVWGLIRGFIRLPGTPQPTSFCSFTSTSVWLQMWNVPWTGSSAQEVRSYASPEPAASVTSAPLHLPHPPPLGRFLSFYRARKLPLKMTLVMSSISHSFHVMKQWRMLASVLGQTQGSRKSHCVASIIKSLSVVSHVLGKEGKSQWNRRSHYFTFDEASVASTTLSVWDDRGQPLSGCVCVLNVDLISCAFTLWIISC